MKKVRRKLLVLLDTHAILHRGYHAMPDFKSPQGEPTGALYGLAMMLLMVLDKFDPEYIVAAYDLPEPTFRHELDEKYKSGRGEVDHDLIHQLDRSHDIFKAFNVPVYERAGFEADDIIGTAVHEVTKRGSEYKDVDIMIASGDMDTLSLVSGKRVRVYTLRKGIKDTIVYDEKAVKDRYGFGPELVADYKALRGDPSDNIVGVPGIGEKGGTELIIKIGGIDDIYTTLKSNRQKFLDLGFKERIIKLLEDHEDEARFSLVLATIRKDAPIDFKLSGEHWRESINKEDVRRIFDELSFRSLEGRLGNILGESEATKKKGEDRPDASPNNEKGGHSEAAGTGERSVNGPAETRLLEETKLAFWVLDSNRTNPSADEILKTTDGTSLKDAKDKLERELAKRGMDKVYREIELPLLPIMREASERGVLIDQNYLGGLAKEYHKELDGIIIKIHKIAGGEINISSPKQLGELLFGKLGLKSKRKTKTGQPATDAATLEKMKGEHEVVDLILEYREVSKLLTTYIDNIPAMLDTDSRLHTTYVLTGTSTGRNSSQDPNLQNIPVRSEAGKRIRSAFVASPGHKLLTLDYSQVDLRCAALLSGDKKLLSYFKGGEDIHQQVASEMGVDRRVAKIINFGILYGMGVTALSKNLGTKRAEVQEFYDRYFLTFSGLASYLESVKEEVHTRGYTETLFGRRRYFPDINNGPEYIQKAAERAAMNAPIQGTTADIIKLGTIRVNEWLAKESLLARVHLILQVHDELIYDVDEGIVDEVAPQIQMIMEGVMEDREIPFPVSVKTGNTWGDL